MNCTRVVHAKLVGSNPLLDTLEKVYLTCSPYSLIKSEIGIEKYILETNKITDRINLSRIRLSNHGLNIEKGRHNFTKK